MLNKKFMFLLLTLIFGLVPQLRAVMLVPAYNENYCPALPPDVVRVVTSSFNHSHVFETQKLIEDVQIWNNAFKTAGDQTLASASEPLCVGFMDDWGAPNAVAVGVYFLLMGQELLFNINLQSNGNEELMKNTSRFVLAHEYAHYLQNLYELEFDYILPMLSTKFKEQHADCMAAYMMRMNDQINDLHSEALEAFIVELADAHAVGDHGTAEQRLLAYRSGSGLSRLDKATGKNSVNTTAIDVIKACGNYYAPTNLR